MFAAAEVEQLIKEGLACDFVRIESEDGVHFGGIVVSAEFDGLSKVKQHQMIYATLGALMGNEIHALQLQTYTPQQWDDVRDQLGL